MQNRIVYAAVGGLALVALGAVTQVACAEDTDFRLIAPLTAIPENTSVMPRTVERVVTAPIVIEATTSNGTLVRGMTVMPVMLERTSVARRHHFPFCFGVWP